ESAPGSDWLFDTDHAEPWSVARALGAAGSAGGSGGADVAEPTWVARPCDTDDTDSWSGACWSFDTDLAEPWLGGSGDTDVAEPTSVAREAEVAWPTSVVRAPSCWPLGMSVG